MSYTHLRDLIVKHKGDKKYVLDRIVREGLEVHGKWFVKDWPEPYYPAYAPPTYVDLMRRLDRQEFEYDGKHCTTENRVESSGRIYTSLIFDDGTTNNYQSLKPSRRRAFLSGGEKLEFFDVSASQLRVALALRGELITFDDSPWDALASTVLHDELKSIAGSERRKIVKRIALMAVKRITRIDVKKMWSEEVTVAPKKNLIGLKAAVEKALYDAYPVLINPLPPLERTFDGYAIQKIKKERVLPVKCRPKKIDTRYKIPEYGKPDENNVVEAIEGWLLREVISRLPSGVPVLTCHDEIATRPEFIPIVRSTWEKLLSTLAESPSGGFKSKN